MNTLLDFISSSMEVENSVNYEFEEFLPENRVVNFGKSDPRLLANNENEQLEDHDDNNVCKYFLKGTCSRGNQCPYKHTRNGLSEKAVVCKHWLRGLCKKSDGCEFLHQYDLEKMPECYFFSKYGECSNPECMYLHLNPDEKLKECQWYARGFCKHGPKCRHKHVKRTMCAWYMDGFCPLGPNCKYAHPRHELPKEEGELGSANMMSSGSHQQGGTKFPQAAGPRGIQCHHCGQVGHKISNCPEKNKPRAHDRQSSQVECYHCHEFGHIAIACPKKPQMNKPQQGGLYPPPNMPPTNNSHFGPNPNMPRYPHPPPQPHNVPPNMNFRPPHNFPPNNFGPPPSHPNNYPPPQNYNGGHRHY